MLVVVVEGEVGGGEFEVEEVGAAGEVEGAGLGLGPGALLEDVFDVLTGVGVAGDGVVEGEGDFVRAVDVSEGDDFVDVDAGVEASGAELVVVGFGAGTEGVEGEEPFGVAGAVALGEQFFDVVGVFEVAVALVAAEVGGDEVVGMIEAEAVGEGVEGD